MTWSANSEAGDAHLRSVFISSSLYHPSVMVSSTSCFLETKIFSWFTNASYTCVWGKLYGQKFSKIQTCEHSSPKIERQMCCACRSSWKLAWLNKSAKALRFPLDHSPLTTSGASRSTRLVFGRTQRISRAFAALRRSTSSGIQTDNGIWSWQLDLVASIEVVKWNGVQKKNSSKLLARVLC